MKLRISRGSILPISPKSSKNLLPIVASLRSCSAGQWQSRCSTSFCSSSSRQLRQNSFAGIPNRVAITPMIQCPVMTPTKVLIEVLFNFSKAEVLDSLSAGQSCLLITQLSMACHAWLVAQTVALSISDLMVLIGGFTDWSISSHPRFDPRLASSSALSFPSIPRCPGIQQIFTLRCDIL